MLRVVRTYGKKGLVIGNLLLLVAFVLSSCNTTKYVPQGQYLLDKAYVKCTDDKSVSTSELRNYLRQRQNTEILGFWKLQLDVYNTAPRDTTTKSNKRLARNAHKMGEAPEIFDEGLASQSIVQLKKALQNQGYFDAEVDTAMSFKERKLTLTYKVQANRPYRLRNVAHVLPQGALRTYAMDKEHTTY